MYGRMYQTAAKNQVRDEELRVLQTKAKDGPSGLPLRMRTRKADVANALLSVLDLNRCGYFVGFDLEKSFAIHKETGTQHFFEFDGESGWDMTVDLEAPEVANEKSKEHEAHRLAELADKSATNSDALKTLNDMLSKLNAAGSSREAEDSFAYPFGRHR